MILKGRQKIVSEFTSTEIKEDMSKLIKLINVSMVAHQINKLDIDYLVNYRNGAQPILAKTKEIRPEINNILVVNHAQMITRSIIGYFLGTPIQYIQNSSEGKEEIEKLNRFISYEDKSSVDKEIGEFQSICGTAYRIIYTDGVYGDEIPFEDRSLNPATTFVVYENNIAEKPLVGVTYYNIYNSDKVCIGVKIYAYTEYGLYEFNTDSSTGALVDSNIPKVVPYSVGGVPIIEYPNNMWRIGDWELSLGLMDAINKLDSGRLDDIDQIVQSLIVFVNAEITEDGYDEMRTAGVVMLKNSTSNPASVATIQNTLDQSGMNMFSQELEDLLYAMIGIPSRNNRGGGGGDTGTAVELRDGWADLETVARNKELVFKKSEKQSLRIILNILKNKLNFKLSLLDVDIKFSRNKNNNLQVKTQSYQTLISTKTLSPADCLTIVDLVSDVNEFISRGQAFWGDSFAGLKEAENSATNSDIGVEQSKVNLEIAKNPPEPVKAEVKK